MSTGKIGRLRIAPRPKYLALALAQVQQSIAYRSATLLGMLSSLLGVAVVYYLWQAVFAAQPQIGGFDWRRMQTYVLLVYIIGALLNETALLPMMQAIRTGQIATDLLHPYSYIGAQFAQAIGRASVQGLVSGAATLLLGLSLVEMAAPFSLASGCLFVLSVGQGFMIMFLINFLTALLCFWTQDAQGLLWAQGTVIAIFSGGTIPLQFFPSWLRLIAFALPFQGVTYTPLAIYLGDAQGGVVWGLLALQAGWVAVLALLVHLVWPHSLRAAELQGG